MVLGIILICLFILGILFWTIGDKYDSFGSVIFGIFGSIVGIIGTIVIIIVGITLENDFEYTESQYYNLKSQVEYVDKDDIVTSENLRNQVLYMNNTIDKHRIYHKNFIIGDFYSERIGNLKKLEWKSN